MSSPDAVDKDLLDNLDLLLAMEMLEKESDWDALEAEGLTEAPDEDLENIPKASEGEGAGSEGSGADEAKGRENSKGEQ
ncbi:MAG: hypothetical protein K2X47_15505 [Bdellovibrionales bacterium]|nr:hypothetical protein [Bdellovibrionales bacterium]